MKVCAPFYRVFLTEWVKSVPQHQESGVNIHHTRFPALVIVWFAHFRLWKVQRNGRKHEPKIGERNSVRIGKLVTTIWWVWCWRCIHSEMEYDEHLLNIVNAKGLVFTPCEKGAKEIERMKKTQIWSTKMCSDRERREHPNCGISRQTQTIENWRPATPPRVGPFF